MNQVKAADLIVIGAPMYNFAIPSGLKAWLDQVLKAGETFQYTSAGPKGLLEGKKAFVVVSSGGVYTDDSLKALDFVEPYLRTALSFIGITDVTFARVEGTAVNLEAGNASLEEALKKASEFAKKA